MDYLQIVSIILLVLGVADLVVGVSNDAVNFLISAIGSRIAKRKYIYIVASIGILLGCLFSGGMMEVARKGIFYPQVFYLDQLLIIFLAVMFTDILLIDIFNTLGYPTSTTVAIVFELLGGALALGLIVIGGQNPDHLQINDIINIKSAFIILAGIVLSIVVAFFTALIIQFVSRLIFTFNYKGKYKILFSFAGAFAITAICFLIIKKDSAIANLLHKDIVSYVHESLFLFLTGIFAAALLLFLVLSYFFNLDVTKVVVLAGTFTIALSFASNDLVNFIGIPLTGFEGMKAFKDFGLTDTSAFLMNIWDTGLLNNNWGDRVYNFVYLVAGIVLVITLFTSKKMRTVTETEMHLGRQEDGYETFEASVVARKLVYRFFRFYDSIQGYMPSGLKNSLNNRYKREKDSVNEDVEGMHFDSVRASVNLVVASGLVALGTYFTIPLSTTFVVFMVVMGTSLADQAWNRDNAVYRLSGVLSILGGWFVTATFAFIGSFIIAVLIWWGQIYMVVCMVAVVAFVLYKTSKYHHKLFNQKLELKEVSNKPVDTDLKHILELGGDRIRKHILESSKIYMLVMQGFVDENLKQLKETCEKTIFLEKLSEQTKTDLFDAFTSLNSKAFDTGNDFTQALDYTGELAHTLKQLAEPVYNHVENQHKGLSKSQKEDSLMLLEEMTGFFNYIIHIEKENRFSAIPDMLDKYTYIINLIEDLRRKQIRRIMDGGKRTRVSIILLECYAESKNIALFSVNLIKSHRKFYDKSFNV